MTNKVQIRPWKPEDAAPLAAICNNKKVWLNLRDRFPHPYTIGNAVEWIGHTLTHNPPENLAIVFNEDIAGGIGVMPKEDVYRKSIEIGYMLGEPYWGKGIATFAVALMIDYIKTHYDIIRIYAEVFSHNKASMRVLEKNCFHLESVRKKTVIKNNVLLDDCVWVKFI